MKRLIGQGQRDQNMSQHEQFENDLEELLGDRLRASKDMCRALWSSLANVDWYCTNIQEMEESHVAYSFRAAGRVIADIRGEGDYMDWYCSGPPGEVDPLIARALYKRGWIYNDISRICDIEDCFNEASSGVPTEDNYYWFCSDHYIEFKKNEFSIKP